MHDSAAAAFESTHRIAADLRAFDGHFPGAPVLPGAYLLALVLHQLEQHPALRASLGATVQVQQVKFLAPVGPGHTLCLRLEAQPQGIGFSAHCGALLVARGRLRGIDQASAP
jgi:3-hydroxymyristoyl/3-hydroxydecanoyl-(acyl carrier protein) dehydratase